MSRLAHRAASLEGEDAVVTLYEPDGDLIAASAPHAIAKLREDWMKPVGGPRFATMSAGGGSSPGVQAIIVAPVRDGSDELLGYLTVNTGMTSLFNYAMGEIFKYPDDESAGHTYWQYVYVPTQGPLRVMYFNEAPGGVQQRIRFAEPDPRLAEILATGSEAGTTFLDGYDAWEDESPQDVMMAYQRIINPGRDDNVYLIAFRPLSEVFGFLNLMAVLGLVGGITFIGILCLNAYRDVHNNIVRPISLLNEGAQIVRQGDFDLKLKIGTGDEIEELATSFNKMAVALKGNIRRLEESEQKYRGVVTSVRDGIYQTDGQGRLTFINPAGARILGFASPESALGVDVSSLFLDKVSFDPFSSDLDHTEGEQRQRFWLRTSEHRRICVELSRNRDFDSNGNPIGVEGIFRDVTESVRLEEAARERSQRISSINQLANVINSSLEAGRLYESLVGELRKLVECDYAAVALLSEDGSMFDGRQLWPDEEVPPGYTFTLDGQDSASGRAARERRLVIFDDLREAPSSIARGFPPEIRCCLSLPLYATGRIIGALNLGSKHPSAFTQKDIDGLEGMAPHLATAIRNAQLLVNLQLSLEEVTRAQEKLAQANEELKTLDEMKTNLLSNVSHELRTPLVSVMGYTDMIVNGKAGPINNTQREYLEISLRNIEKLVTLIENLLDFSRLHRGDERLVFDTFDLVDCARSSIQVIRPVADSRDIAIRLSAPSEPVLVEGDKGKMGQVFNNLLSNAVKFNQNGGRVDVELIPGQAQVEVIVSDSGIGMPQEALEKVFTRFYQYDASSTRKYGGTGIGLSIAQDIVRLHGSIISVSSDEGRGSVFRFRLNLSQAGRATDDGGLDGLPTPHDTHMLIELVSRDRAMSSQMRHILAGEGMDMIHATSPETAVGLAHKHNPDCIVVDVLDDGDGQEVLDDIVQDSMAGRLPIVLLTNDEDTHRKYKALVASRIKRSFRKSSLLSGIHHALTENLTIGEPVGDKILCVDDDAEILSFMRRCLETEGYEVDCCSTGQEALAKLKSLDYGLVLLDIAMPGMDGWETACRIRANPDLARVNLYMVTAKPIDQQRNRVKECGADGFLLKPFRSEDLVQLVQGLDIRATAKERDSAPAVESV